MKSTSFTVHNLYILDYCLHKHKAIIFPHVTHKVYRHVHNPSIAIVPVNAILPYSLSVLKLLSVSFLFVQTLPIKHCDIKTSANINRSIFPEIEDCEEGSSYRQDCLIFR